VLFDICIVSSTDFTEISHGTLARRVRVRGGGGVGDGGGGNGRKMAWILDILSTKDCNVTRSLTRLFLMMNTKLHISADFNQSFITFNNYTENCIDIIMKMLQEK